MVFALVYFCSLVWNCVKYQRKCCPESSLGDSGRRRFVPGTCWEFFPWCCWRGRGQSFPPPWRSQRGRGILCSRCPAERNADCETASHMDTGGETETKRYFQFSYSPISLMFHSFKILQRIQRIDHKVPQGVSVDHQFHVEWKWSSHMPRCILTHRVWHADLIQVKLVTTIDSTHSFDLASILTDSFQSIIIGWLSLSH